MLCFSSWTAISAPFSTNNIEGICQEKEENGPCFEQFFEPITEIFKQRVITKPECLFQKLVRISDYTVVKYL